MNSEIATRRYFVEETIKSMAQMDLDKLRLAYFLCLVLVLNEAEQARLMEIIQK